MNRLNIIHYQVHEVSVARNVLLPVSWFYASSYEAMVSECGFEVGVRRGILSPENFGNSSLKSVLWCINLAG